MNIAQWYAFKFFFTTSHYAMAYVAAGAVLVHIGVKLPVIRRALGEPLDDIPTGELCAPGRRGAPCWAAPGWRWASPRSSPRDRRFRGFGNVSVLAPRSGKGRRGFRSTGRRMGGGRAAQRAVTGLPADGDQRRRREGIQPRRAAAMPQTTHRLPIACVEGLERRRRLDRRGAGRPGQGRRWRRRTRTCG